MSDLIDKQAALDAIMGQPPEPHYPSWYAAQIKKLPAVQPATNCSEIPNGSDDTISRQAAIDALDEQIEQCNKALGSFDISPKDEYAIKVERASLEAYKEQLENMPSAQPDEIPLEWIDKHLEWLDNCDNDFAQLAKVSIKAMVELWKKDRI